MDTHTEPPESGPPSWDAQVAALTAAAMVGRDANGTRIDCRWVVWACDGTTATIVGEADDAEGADDLAADLADRDAEEADEESIHEPGDWHDGANASWRAGCDDERPEDVLSDWEAGR